MIEVYDNPGELCLHAAEKFSAAASEAKARFRVAVSGGATPLGMFQILASKPFQGMVDWKKVDLFWVDERIVPPTHDESNFGHARKLLLDRVEGVAVHRIHGELPPEEAASRYEAEIREVFGLSEGMPAFDLIILGMGADGHTASLFPGSSALKAEGRIAVAVSGAESGGLPRVTLTLPAINAARSVIFLVSGDAKSAPLRRVLAEGDHLLPAGMVRPESGKLLWMADKAAARGIAR